MDWLTIFGRVLLGASIFGVAGIFAYLYWREKKDVRGLVEYYKKREEIEHLGEEGGGNASGNGMASTSGGAQGANTDDKGGLQAAYESYKAIKGFAPVASAVAVGKQISTWQVSVANRNSGNSLMQRKVDVGMQLATQVLTSGGTVLGGLITGNPLLVFGGVTSAIMTGLNYSKEQEQVNYERRWEDMALVYARERAGISYNKSRTE